MLEVVKKSINRYQITNAVMFSKYGDVEDRAKALGDPLERRGFSRCFVCGHKFEREEWVFLAIIKNHKNMFICKDCHQKCMNEVKP